MTLKITELRALFARSGNRCAFPGCDQPLVDDDNLFIGQICHIEAQSIGGPRYNPDQVDAERNSPGNLLLLCYPHHRRVDSDTSLYTVQWLQNNKAAHEIAASRTHYELEPDVALRIFDETKQYWRRLHLIQTIQENQHEFPMAVDPDASFTEVLTSLCELIENIEHLVGQATGDNDPEQGGTTRFEATNIFLPNVLQLCRLHIKQLDVHFQSCQLQLTPGNASASASYEAAKAQLVSLVMQSGYVD